MPDRQPQGRALVIVDTCRWASAVEHEVAHRTLVSYRQARRAVRIESENSPSSLESISRERYGEAAQPIARHRRIE